MYAFREKIVRYHGRKTGDVAARAREALNEAKANGIGHRNEYNRNGGSCRFQSYGSLRTGANEQIGPESDKFVREMISDLGASRELAWRLFVRDVSAQYRTSLLGYVWVFLPPLVASVPFVYLTSAGVIRIAETPIPYAAYAMVGAIIWQTFVEALNSPLRAVNAARSMLTRINFPREAILLSGLMQVAFTFVVRLVLVIAVFVAFALTPPATSPLFLVGMISVALTGFMIGLVDRTRVMTADGAVLPNM